MGNAPASKLSYLNTSTRGYSLVAGLVGSRQEQYLRVTPIRSRQGGPDEEACTASPGSPVAATAWSCDLPTRAPLFFNYYFF